MAEYTEQQLDNINTAIQANITTVLETINDPKGRKHSSNFLYQSDPRSKAADFGSYPIIYIENYSNEDISQNVGGNLFNIQASAEFHLIANDDSAQQKRWHDQISDELEYLFRRGERQVLADNGIGQPTIVRSERITGIDRDEQPVIRREIEVQMPMQLDSQQVNGDPYA